MVGALLLWIRPLAEVLSFGGSQLQRWQQMEWKGRVQETIQSVAAKYYEKINQEWKDCLCFIFGLIFRWLFSSS